MMGEYHEDENEWNFLHIEDDEIWLGRVFNASLDASKVHCIIEESCDNVFRATMTKREMGALVQALQNMYERMVE